MITRARFSRAFLPQFQDVLAGLVDQVIFPVAQEGEVSVIEPPEEVLGLAKFLDLGGIGHVVQVLGDLEGLVAHLGPVFDGRPHIAEHAFDAFDEPLPGFLAGKADFDGDPGLHVRGVVTLGNQV